MDIIDIMLAKAMTPQGQTDTYVAKANKAAAKAEKAEQDAQAAIDTVTAASETIAAAQEEAANLLEAAQEALETAQEAQINTIDMQDVDDEIKKFHVSYSRVTNNATEFYTNLHYEYPDKTGGVIPSIVALQKRTGTSEVAGMTQKAITDALNLKADSSALAGKADKTYVDQKIAAIPSGGGGGSANINLNSDNAGHIVVIDDEGRLAAGDITEAELIETMLRMGTYIAKSALGLEVDYTNKIFTRTQNAINLSTGSDFDAYPMYGGRMRCNVADDGTINAFYGDPNYTEDGSNGQVMVYQPKFYYQRIPLVLEDMTYGKVIRKESLIISYEQQVGFKVAPIFESPEGELDYVLFSAYEGSVINNQLASIANVKPSANINIVNAEAYAANRGAGWHITNIAAEATNQML